MSNLTIERKPLALNKDDVILAQQQVIAEQNETIAELRQAVAALRLQVAALQKDSSNSSKPPSSDAATRKRINSRKHTGRKSGAQRGRRGKRRQWKKKPDNTVVCAADVCEGCGKPLSRCDHGRVVCKSQVTDVPPVTPVTTEYQQVSRTCGDCGHATLGALPDEAGANGTSTIGANASAFLVYMSSAHHTPYARLAQISADLFGFDLSQGTIANKLEAAATAAEPLRSDILAWLRASKWVGSDETGVKIGGCRWWQWVWQNDGASLFAVSARRDQRTILENFGSDAYAGTLVHDCYNAQNNTGAATHQLCHAHLLRDLQFSVEVEGSAWAWRAQELLLRTQRARERVWGDGFDEATRWEQQGLYKRRFDALLSEEPSGEVAAKLRKRLVKHREKVLYFLGTPDVPADNNGSERAIRNARVKEKVSGGYRSERGAQRQATLLSVIETVKKQRLSVIGVIKGLMSSQPVQLFA